VIAHPGTLHPDAVLARAEGVTASFVKELLRRAALQAAREPEADGEQAGPLRATDAHLNAALDQLLGTRNQLTRVLLGGRREAGGRKPGTPASAS
jgi:hypothetical protein